MNQRDLWSWKATRSNEWLAGQCVMRYKAIVRFDSHGRETNQLIEFGAMPVRLPWRDEELRLVVVKGFGRKPMMLLTNLAVNEKLQTEGKDGTEQKHTSSDRCAARCARVIRPDSERRLTREVHYSWQNRLHPYIIGAKPISVTQKP